MTELKLERAIIDPRPHRDDPVLSRTAVLSMTPHDLGLLRRQAANEPKLASVRDFFQVYTVDGGPALAGPALGAPAAVMAAEKLFALGVERLFFTGWCGSLTPEAPAGSLILPAWAVSEEGASAHYPVPGRAEADRAMAAALIEAGRELGLEIIQGPVWTTDAIYRETPAKAAGYAAEGVWAVEMETAALYAVARFRGKRAAGLLLVSDEVHGSSWRPAFGSRRLEKARENAARILLKAADMME